MTYGRAEIHELLAANELHPSRALGQNFVADGNTVRRIARLADIAQGQPVVEIGAGLGSLTLALAEAGASVTAVEIDRHVVPVLRRQVEPLGVRVVEADALTVDWSELLGPPGSAGQEWALVANLPYNVAVPLVIRVLEEAPQVASLLVMVQREVGERLAAAAGAEAYGAVSVKVAYWASASLVGRVPASVFVPRPKVESVLVRLVRHPGRRPGGEGTGAVGPGAADYERLFTVVRAGFAHRRKMLRRSLDGLVEQEAFDTAGIRPTSRAEELSLPEWERLAAWPGEVADSDESHGSARRVPAELTAPAKLTVTLRVTGVRADGYHLLESEMVSLDLVDSLVVEEGDGLTVSTGDPTDADGWSMAVPEGADNLVARALVVAGRNARVRLTKRIPPGAGLGGGLLGRGGHPAVGRDHRPRVGRPVGSRRAVLSGRGSGHGPGHRRGRHAVTLRRTGVPAPPPALRSRHGCRLPDLGPPGPTAGAAAGWRQLERPGESGVGGRAPPPEVEVPVGGGHRAKGPSGRQWLHLVRGGTGRGVGPGRQALARSRG